MCRDEKQIIILVFRTKRSKWGLRELGVTIWRYLHKLIILATVNIIIGLHHQQHNHHMSPVWQRSPVVPFGQSQTNGFVHFPPFKQDGWQNAEDDHTYKLGCFYKAFRLMCVSSGKIPPVWHRVPVYPGKQAHTSGRTQLAPFLKRNSELHSFGVKFF